MKDTEPRLSKNMVIPRVVSDELELFNHVDTNEEMWAGEGDRWVRREIKFSEPYKQPPHVILAVQSMDSSRGSNLRYRLDALDQTTKGFTIQFHTWGDTKIARVAVTWTAIGSNLHAALEEQILKAMRRDFRNLILGDSPAGSLPASDKS